MSRQNFYGNDYKAAMPTMDRQVFHPVEGISWSEWDLLLSLHDAYCAIRYQWEPFKVGGHDNERFDNKLDRVRKDLAGLLNDAIHEIEARREVREAEGYAKGGTVDSNQADGMTLDDACRHAAAEACVQMGIVPKGSKSKTKKGKTK